MSNKKTLPEALGLSQEWYDETTKRIEKDFGDITETISDYMVVEANNIREEEFGEVDVKLTNYEMKLVLVGYLIGLERVKMNNPLGALFQHFLESREEEGDE